MAPLPPTAVALCVMLLLAASCAAVARATAPARVHVATRPPAVVAAERVVVARRAAAAAAVGVVVLLATSWLVLAALAAAMVATWGRLLHDDRAAEERERVEGIAKWLEDLRDTLRGCLEFVAVAIDHRVAGGGVGAQRLFLIGRGARLDVRDGRAE